jgi:eukaryotic-like serine/threonine-protein kinase
MMPEQTHLGRYELLEYLGGGMADVYRASDALMNRIVAIKILKEAHCSDADAKARFVQEARVAGNLLHENIIRVYDFGEDERQRPYMIMEFLEGRDFAKAIRSSELGELGAKLKLADSVADALHYIHSRKIVHRDIKPENIFLTNSGQVKLMDFGIARQENMSLTQAGFVIGTPSYMAPEQIRGERATELVDVYAFGVLLFELTTAQKAFAGKTYEQIFHAILNEPLSAEPLHSCGASDQLIALIQQCVAKNPLDRPQGLQAVRAALRELPEMTGRAATAAVYAPTQIFPEAIATPPKSLAVPAAPAPVSKTRPKPSKGVWISVGCAAAVLLLIGIYFAVRPKQPVSARSHPVSIAMRTGEMVLVPAGPFKFGEDNHSEPLPAFYIDKTEVSNDTYSMFAQETGHLLPPGFRGDKPEWPIVNIRLEDAAAFAAWAGKRLPTYREWEKAARGIDGRVYPWGESADFQNHANVAAKPKQPGTPLPVAALPGGHSPFGALQMVGNVWEWVNEPTRPTAADLRDYAKILKPPPTATEPWVQIRGGSYKETLDPKVMWDGVTVPARLRNETIGFRCAKDADGGANH